MTDHRTYPARARDKWLASPEGQKCLRLPVPAGPYQEHRLERAFVDGFDAAYTWFSKHGCIANLDWSEVDVSRANAEEKL